MGWMSRALDRVMRHVLGIPGALLEWLDGGPASVCGEGPDDVADIIRSRGRCVEAYLGLESGLQYHHFEGSVLAWQRRARTAFGIGGLNVPPHQKQALLEDFIDATKRLGIRRTLVFPLRQHERMAAERAGVLLIQVGVEAWIDLAGFSLRGRRMEGLRQMNNRARRRGVTIREVSPNDLMSSALSEQLAEVHERWLERRRPAWRMRLLVGSPALDRPWGRRYLVASKEGKVEAFMTLVPGGDGEWGVDVMCRRPSATAGVMERLITDAAERLQQEGAERLSLGPCPMAGIKESDGRPWLSWFFRQLYGSAWGNTLFGFRNLYAFKAKFRPRWEPVWFGASPSLGVLALYRGCRMWGLL